MAKNNIKNVVVPTAQIAKSSESLNGKNIANLLWYINNPTENSEGLFKSSGYAYKSLDSNFWKGNGPFICFGNSVGMCILQFNMDDGQLYLKRKLNGSWSVWSTVSSLVPTSLSSENMIQKDVIDHNSRGGGNSRFINILQSFNCKYRERRSA